MSGEMEVQVYCSHCLRDLVVKAQPSEINELIARVWTVRDGRYYCSNRCASAGVIQ